MLVKTFVKVHSADNLSNEERSQRDRTLERNGGDLHDEREDNEVIHIEFTVTEELNKSRKTTPGRNQISCCMLSNLSDKSKEVFLKLCSIIRHGKRVNYLHIGQNQLLFPDVNQERI